MKAYLISTGSAFALLVLAHLARVAMEGTRLLTEPDFVLATIVPACLGVWAWRLYKRLPAAP
jgi:hypothetical protein